MKRKIFAIICAICMITVLALPLASCTATPNTSGESNADGNPSGVVNAMINEHGELVLIYGDGTKQTLGNVVGKDGVDGKDGIDGKDGVDGKDGTDGKDGVDGKDGINGANGKDGKDGKDGLDGKDGTNGANGSLVITDGGNNVPYAIAKGLRSAVSINCNFTDAEAKKYGSAGSGVIYRLDKAAGDAFIVTNYHIVYDPSSATANRISDDIKVYLYGAEFAEKALKATYVGGSLNYDIAVLHIDDSELLREADIREADIANSDTITVGETAIAIGNAKGYGISASSGIVNVDSEQIDMTAADGVTEVSTRVMRIDTAVNPGNSGGGLFNGNGELIGIVNAKLVETKVENIGYAIPSNIVTAVANNIIDLCYGTELESMQRALLGISVATEDSKAIYDPQTGKISIVETIKIHEVTATSLAKGALEAGDILVSAALNERAVNITRRHHIVDLMLNARLNDTVSMTVLRGEEEMTFSFTVTESCITPS